MAELRTLRRTNALATTMPPWNGSGLRWWTLVGGVSFLLYFVLLVYCEVRRPEAPGFAIQFGRNLIANVIPGSPGDRAGLRVGDTLVAVDGRPIRSVLDWRVVESQLVVGTPLRITIDRQGTRANHDVAVRWLEPLRHAAADRLTLWVARVVQGITLLLALLVALKRPDDARARVGAALLAGIGVFTVLLPPRFAAVWHSLPLPISVLLWVPFVAWIAIGVLWFVFIALFPRTTELSHSLWMALLTPFVVVAAWHVWHGALMVYAPADAMSIPDWSIAVVLSGVAYAAAGVVLLVVKYRGLTDPNERRRVRILMAGSIIGLASGLPVVLGRWLGVLTSDSNSLTASPAPAIGMLLLLSFPTAFAYATVRHRMFDISVIIRQGLRYTLARRLLLSLVPALVALIVVDALLHQDQTIGTVLRAHGPLYGSLLAIIAVASMRRDAWLESLDRRFFRERYKAQQVLRRLVEEIRRHAGDFALVAPTVVTQLEATFHPRFAQILLRDPGAGAYRVVAAVPAGQAPEPPRPDSKVMGVLRVLAKPIEISHADTGWIPHHLPADECESLRRSGVDLLIPIIPSIGDTEAVLVLGEKRSEEPYSAEDQDLLGAIAQGLALLLERRRKATADAPTLEECPDCGACYDSGSGVCNQEGSRLNAVPVTRTLAGRYRLSHRLGQGGMGAVYAAVDLSLGREVAAKLIREDVMQRPDAADRFHREARLAAGFAHPNVVTVHDFGLTRGRAFLIMELVDGSTLRQEIEAAGPIPPPRVRTLLSGICAAIEEAHNQQLVHRDLKPENVMLTGKARDLAKILDFGIAKLVQTETRAPDHRDTAADVRVGTLQYMAPEQLRGEDTQPAWDLWALGVLTFEMLTGRLPFTAPVSIATPRDGLWNVGLPAPSALSAIEGDWQGFFNHALALDPTRRPQSASAFLREFDRASA